MALADTLINHRYVDVGSWTLPEAVNRFKSLRIVRTAAQQVVVGDKPYLQMTANVLQLHPYNSLLRIVGNPSLIYPRGR